MPTVLVFKTSVCKKRDINKIKPFLNNLITKNGYWNFDLEDCGNILRVDTKTISSATICVVLNNHGFWCEELY